MGSGDLSTDLALNLNLGILTPASAVRAVDGHSASQDTQGKARRRSRPDEESSDDLGSPSDADDQPAHQLDHLA
jgi:hypothetical protein